MKICVVGCGAMGSIYAALLADSGHDVMAVDTNTGHVDAINRQGLRVSGASGERVVKISAFTEPPIASVDLVICAVKAKFAREAAESFTPLLAAHAHVLTIQNGLGSAEQVAEVVGADRLILGVAQGFGASLPEPGHAHHNDMKAIRMGAYAGLPQTAVEEVAGAWVQAGFDAAAVEDIIAMQWGKLICNVAYSAPCALTGFTVGEVLQHPHMGEISRAAAREAYEVAQALDIKLSFSDPEQEVREFAARMPEARPSVLLDIQAGRTSEVDVINGAVPTQAAKVGMRAPVNEVLTQLVQILEQRTQGST